jgi:hypothetical protein
MNIRGLDFKPVDPRDIPPRAVGPGRPSRYLATIREFLISGARAVAVDADVKDPSSVATCLRAQVRKAGLETQVLVVQRGERVFILRVTP